MTRFKAFTKTIISIISVVTMGLLSTNALAWGPERPTFTMENPADYAVFNSITNNPTIGDERDFVRVGEINSDVTHLGNEVEVVPGKQYLVYIYFHNNASSTYNDVEHNRSGVALRTRMSTFFPAVLTPAEKGTVSATITADNTNPLSVWDEAYFTTKADQVILSYVAGTAKIYNDWGANGSVMPSNLFTSGGTLIGLNALNGVIPGCEEYHGVVTYVVEAKGVSTSFQKTVAKNGAEYAKSVTIGPGEEVDFMLTIENTGGVDLVNVKIKDTMPVGLTLVSGSARLIIGDSSTSISDDIVKDGYNLGILKAGDKAYITYRAKAGDDFDCDGQTLTNTAKLTYDVDGGSNGTNTDSSQITVIKTTGCEPEPEQPSGSIKKTVSGNGTQYAKAITITPGDEIYFRLEIENTGTVAMSNIKIRDTMPAGLSLVPGTVSLLVGSSTTPSSLPDSVVSDGYTLKTLNAGEKAYLTYRAKAGNNFDCDGKTLTNTATLSYDNQEPSNDNHTSSSNITVKKTTDCEPKPEKPSGSIQKTVSTDGIKYSSSVVVAPGDEVHFQLEIKNTSNATLTNIKIKDILPTGLTLVSGSIRLATDNSDELVSVPDSLVGDGYIFGNLDKDKSIYLTYRAKASNDFDCDGKTLTNTATLSYDNQEASGNNHTSSSNITVKKLTGCDPELPVEIVNTGPLEIVMAIIIVIAIGGVGAYYWHTKRTLKTIENKASGKVHTDNHEPAVKNHESAGSKTNQNPTPGTQTGDQVGTQTNNPVDPSSQK